MTDRNTSSAVDTSENVEELGSESRDESSEGMPGPNVGEAEVMHSAANADDDRTEQRTSTEQDQPRASTVSFEHGVVVADSEVLEPVESDHSGLENKSPANTDDQAPKSLGDASKSADERSSASGQNDERIVPETRTKDGSFLGTDQKDGEGSHVNSDAYEQGYEIGFSKGYHAALAMKKLLGLP
mmetsp:Transcript_18947/g.47620  ORF Transcript_18947/g.47620 Transcript_18947/m.47620 type:complete len:185 (+) Transcript_18947:537-1091(+)